MLNARSLIGGLAASTAMIIGTFVFVPGTASAATYGGQCGGGYGVVASAGVTGGTVFLTYNNATGTNCVVTVRDQPGAAEEMVARVGRTGDPGSVRTDKGNFTTYAGPVYVPAAHHCVDWDGDIKGSWGGQNDSHCQ
jgi:hypothetical protein